MTNWNAQFGGGRPRVFRALCALAAGAALGSGMLLHQPMPTLGASPYAAAVLADAPTVYYRLGESSGPVADDSSGNNNDGTYMGSPIFGVTGATTDGNTAVTFPSSGANYVSSGYTPGSDAAFTLETWVYLPAGFATDGYLAGTTFSAGNGKGFDWSFNADRTSTLTLSLGVFSSMSLPAISTQSWHMLAFTFDGLQVCGYVDAHQTSCSAATGPVNAGHQLAVGADPNQSPNGAGLTMDEFGYFQHALTTAQVLAEFDSRGPEVTSVAPSSGPLNGGTSVTISGYAFSNATAVSFGGTAASSFTVNNDDTITATAPGAATVGAVDVTVTGPGGTSATSASDTFTYTAAATTTAQPVPSANPSTYSQPVTFSTTVSSGGPTPTGNVTWKDGATTLGTSTLDGSGHTSYVAGGLAGGTHSITAVYGGDGFNLGSTSPSLSQVVNTTGSVIGTPSSSQNPSTYGQSVTFSVSVAGSGVVPTGSVTWLDGGTSLGTTALSGGSTSLTTAALTAGSHTISAQYSGDGNYAAGTGPGLTQSVGQSSTITSLNTAPNPSAEGQSVTITAIVTPVSPGAGTPTGTVAFSDGGTVLGSSPLNGSAQATFAATLTGGSHTITAQYSGDSNFITSTASPVVQTVNQSTPAVSSVTPSANPASYGSSISFSVTITGPGFPPTGTASFYDGGTLLGTAPLNGSGTATFSTSALTGGAHTINVLYSGDVNYSGAWAAALNETVDQATPSVSTPTSTNNPSAYTQNVTFSTTLSGAGSTPTGTVTWMDGATSLGTSSVNGSGVATFSTTALAVGGHSITAVYGGDGNYTGFTSSAFTETVNKATPTVPVPAAAPNPSVYGQGVTFSVTVTGPGATPTGTITWLDGATPLATTPLSSGSASLTFSTLAAGPHSISAQYNGDGNYIAGTSAAVSQTVNQAQTTTSLGSAPNPSSAGTTVTYTATVAAVAPGAGIPTGSVTFTDNGVPAGSAPLNGAGVATFNITESGGTHTVTASYGGDSEFIGSTSSPLTQTVNPVTSTVTLSSSTNPSVYGSAVTFNVTVSGSSFTPTGTVTFYDGATLLGSSTLNGAGSASFTTSTLTGGSHSISATYGGDVNNTGASSPLLTQSVGQATPVVSTPASSVNPSTYTQSVTFSTNVSGAGTTPTGTVTWMDGVTSLGTSSVDGSGNATFSIATLTGGPHPITAVYGGDGNYTSAGSGATVQTVNTATPTVSTPTASPNPSVFGQGVTFSVNVAGPGVTPTGTVTWYDGATPLATTTLSGGSTSLSYAALAPGGHSITAQYSGDANYAVASSAAVTQTVNQAQTTTTLASVPNPSVAGQSVTYTATVAAVAPGSGTPTGGVTFFDNGSPVATTALNGAGVATFSLVENGGVHTINATYGGDPNFTVSMAAQLTQTVNRLTPVVSSITSSLNPSSYSSPVTLSVSVTGTFTTPSGTVVFGDGATAIGTATLDSSGHASLILNTLGGGSHTITAVYDGDVNYVGAASASLNQVVTLVSSSVATPTSSPNPSIVTHNVTFSTTVSGSGLAPTGTVTWMDGTTTLGTSTLSAGVTTFSTSSLTAGAHGISAVYGGDGNYTGATSLPLTQTVNPAPVVAVAVPPPPPSPQTPAPTPAPQPTPATPSHGGTVTPPKPPVDSNVSPISATPWWVKIGSDLAVKSAFPLLLIILALLFLAIQDRIDRKDPKLALAPARPDPELTFPAPRGTP